MRLPNCCTCGRCCVAPVDATRYVTLTVADLNQLPAAAIRRYVQSHESTWAPRVTLRTRATPTGPVCAALHGTVDQRVSCAIYVHRPLACRQTLHPGDPVCLALRAEGEGIR